ncbi:MAG: pectinesterase family protein [Opitutaceae bacterium]
MNQSPSPIPAVPPFRAAHYRWIICALLFFATTINHMDRAVLGVLAPALRAEIGWTDQEYGYINAGFTLAFGPVKTIQEAIEAVQWHRVEPVEIFIKAGEYDGIVRVPRERPNLRFIGEDRKRVIITALNNERLHPNSGWPARSAFVVEADDVVIENLTIRNTTPKGGSQAEALYVNGQRCIIRDCDFYSFQDTLNLSGRVYVENCYIEGDVDFAWGYGSVVFKDCELKAVRDGCYVQSRNAAGVHGMVFVDCTLSAAPATRKCRLGRIELDRFPGSEVAFIRCRMGSHIPPAGWIVTGEGRRDQLRFVEFGSTDLEGMPIDVSEMSHPNFCLPEVWIRPPQTPGFLAAFSTHPKPFPS